MRVTGALQQTAAQLLRSVRGGDCMTSLDTPDDGLSSVHVAPGDVVVLCISGAGDLKNRCPGIYEALVECSAFVNYRKTEKGKQAVLALSFYA